MDVLRALVRSIVEHVMFQLSSAPPVELGTQEWEWTEMTHPESADDEENEPVTKPMRI